MRLLVRGQSRMTLPSSIGFRPLRSRGLTSFTDGEVNGVGGDEEGAYQTQSASRAW